MIDRRLKQRVSKFYNYIHETSSNAAAHKALEQREIFTEPRREMAADLDCSFSQIQRKTWRPYMIEKLKEMDNPWTRELLKALDEVEVDDTHWQEEFFWKQSYNSLVLAPR